MKNEVSVFKGKTDLTVRGSDIGHGSQEVTSGDVVIPRIKVLQLISDEVITSNPKYIEGAQAGMFLNSVTNELYSSLYVVNLYFSRKTVVWKKRKVGGGMFGTFLNEAEALDALAKENEPVANYDISENPTHLLMVIDDDGKSQGIVLLDMPGSKIKHSKRWNTLISAQEDAGNPRYGCVWELSVIADSSSSGPFSNCEAKFIVHAPDDIYQAAKREYDRFFPSIVEQAA